MVGELLHARGVLALYLLLHKLHVLVLGFFVGQCLQIVVGLDNEHVHLLGDGQHLLHVINQSVVSLSLLGILKHGLRVAVDGVQLNILYAVAALKCFSHLHHGHKRGVVHVDLAVLGMHLGLHMIRLRRQSCRRDA